MRAVGRYGHVLGNLNAKAVNCIFKERCQLAGLDVEKYADHCLRSGFIISAASKGLPESYVLQKLR